MFLLTNFIPFTTLVDGLFVLVLGLLLVPAISSFVFEAIADLLFFLPDLFPPQMMDMMSNGG
ncbi:MAG: hypothetical protein HUU22_05195 [Phycisphaerae bacterium]|nr:hypothetical protein [Phycisphaerae bacterium]NUQ45409.1 hypothetical protein [Phycisphaerae bacterium]